MASAHERRFTPEQVETAAFCMTVLSPRADALRRECERLPWWRMLARERALRRYRSVLMEWEQMLVAAGLVRV